MYTSQQLILNDHVLILNLERSRWENILRFPIALHHCQTIGVCVVRDDSDGMENVINLLWLSALFRFPLKEFMNRIIRKTFLQTESASLNFILHGILIPFPELIKSESYLKFLLPHLHAIVNWISLMYQDRFDKNLFDFFSLFPSAKNSLAFKLNFLFPSGTFLEWINLSQSAINLIWKIFLISFFR